MDNDSLLSKTLYALKLYQKKYKELADKLHEPIAIIGMGGRFPGSINLAGFWTTLITGQDGIITIPPDRWNAKQYYDPDPSTPDKMYVCEAGFLSQVDHFDPLFFEISPREAITLDPQQRILLEVVWEAIENAGIPPSSLMNQLGGVFIGIYSFDYLQLVRSSNQRNDQYAATGNLASTAAGRISYTLGLQGPCLSIDTACSSSLVAIHEACQSLRKGDSDIAIAGGVNLILTPEPMISTCKASMLSPDGRCKTFDVKANGFGRGEGCGIIVLKRLNDAIKANDSILAVIRGSAINQDGPSAGLTVPNSLSQRALIKSALKDANLNPSDIDYIEAHGTGTSLGDPIEIEALDVLSNNRKEPLLIGSVKSNIGHTESAAGVAGVIKVVLSLQNEVIPKNLHFNTLNPHINLDAIPGQVVKEPHSWKKKEGHIRRAGVSSFAINGTNAHVILEEAPLQKVSQEIDHPFSIFTLSAKSEKTLQEYARGFVDYLELNPNISLSDICYMASTGRDHYANRLAVVCESVTDLTDKLKNNHYTLCPIPKQSPTLAFVFIGDKCSPLRQMGRELYQNSPPFKNAVDQCADIFSKLKQRSLLEFLFELPEKPEIDYASVVFEYALARLLMSWGIYPEFVIGNGYGELTAAMIAGMISLEEAFQLLFDQTNASSGKITFQPPQIQFLSSSQNQLVNSTDSKYWKDHWLKNIELADTIALLQKQEVSTILVIGNGSVLEISKPLNDQPLLTSESIWKTLLNAIAKLYISGFSIDWKNLEKPYSRQKTPLPTYPFDKARYWVTPSTFSMPSNQAQYIGHPFLRNQVDTPLLTVFSSEVTENFPDFIPDHKIRQSTIVAGASFLSAILSAAASFIPDAKCLELENVDFLSPAIVPKEQPLNLEILTFPAKGTKRRFEIYSRYQESEWTMNLSGSISECRAKDTEKKIDPQAQISSYDKDFPGTEFYHLAKEKFGFDFGPQFMWIEHIYAKENEIFAKLRTDSSERTDQNYILPPGLLDSFLHALIAEKLLTDNKSGELSLPLSLEKFHYLLSDKKPKWVHAVLIPQKSKEISKAVISLFAEDGSWLGEITNFVAKRVPTSALNELTQDKSSPYLYEIDFEQIPLIKTNPATITGNWLLFSEQSSLSENLSRQLGQIGASCLKVDLNTIRSKTEISSFVKNHSTNLTGILFLAPDKQSAYSNLLSLIQALVENQSSNTPLFLVTHGTQPLEKEMLIEASTLSGLWKTAVLEYPELKIHHIDLDVVKDPVQHAALLLDEILYPSEDDQIVYRKLIRYAPRLKRVSKQNKERDKHSLMIVSTGSYLVTGGLGALGLQVTKWLINKGAKHLVLLARSAPSDETRAFLKKLEHNGATIEISQTDISNESEAYRLIKNFGEKYPKLKGIVHAAGVLADNTLLNQDENQFAKVSASKIQGTINLHRATKDLSLDFFLLFSSLASVLGAPGQSNYAAANAFMDSFAHFRRAQGLPAISISWGPWSGPGMAEQLSRRAEASGVKSFTGEEGLTILEMICELNPSHTLAVSADWDKYTEKFKSDIPFFKYVLSPKKEIKVPQLQKKLQGCAPALRNKIISDHIKTLVVQALGLSATQDMTENQGFFEFGMDSLIAMELKNKLQADIGDRFILPSTLLFDNPNLEALSKFLLNLLSDKNIASEQPKAPSELEKQFQEMPLEDLFKLIDRNS